MHLRSGQGELIASLALLAVIGILLIGITKYPAGEYLRSLGENNNLETISPPTVSDYKEMEGYLEVWHTDDFENPTNSKYTYYLYSNGQRYEIASTEDLNYRLSGAKVKIKGQFSGSILSINQEQTDALTILSNPPDPREENIGPQKTLVIILGIGNLTPPSKEGVQHIVFNYSNNTLQDYYIKNSYNKVSFEGDVFGPYFFNNYSCADINVRDLALNAIVPEVNLPDYERIIIVHVCGGNSGTIGKVIFTTLDGEVRASVSLVSSFHWGFFAHELGHNFGLLHANLYKCQNRETEFVPYSFDCNSIEYQDEYDVMGQIKGHLNAPHKEETGWLTENNSIIVTNGTYLLKPLETIEATGSIQQIKLPISIESSFYAGLDDIYYSIEFRQPFDYDGVFSINPSVYNGVLIRIANFNFNDIFIYQTNIINIHPEQYIMHQLEIGQSYTDEINGYNITLDNITIDGAWVTIKQIPKLDINFDNPIVYYDFNDGNATDKAGYAKDGIVYGGAIPSEGGLFFDGTDDYVELGGFSSAYISYTNEFTISTWIKIKKYPIVFYKIPIYEAGGLVLRMWHPLTLNKGVQISVPVQNITNIIVLETDKNLSEEVWYHIVSIYNGSEVALYINGDKKASKEITGEIILGKAKNGYLGGRQYSVVLFGIIDEFKIYAKGLSSQEIKDLYLQGKSFCGDVNGDNVITLADIIYLVNYLFKGGQAPIGNGDANGDGKIRLSDIILIVNYLFKGGAKPTCGAQQTTTSESASYQLVQTSSSNINLNGNLQIPAAGLQLELLYDSSKLTVFNVTNTSRTSGLSIVVDKSAAGRIRIGVYDLGGSKAIPSGSGTLLTIRFSGNPAGANLRIASPVTVSPKALELKTSVLANRFTTTTSKTIQPLI